MFVLDEIVTTNVEYNNIGRIYSSWYSNVWKAPGSESCHLKTDKFRVTASTGSTLILKVRPCPSK